MFTDGDKIAAATLTAALLERIFHAPDDPGKIAKAIELYGDVLQKVKFINPDTGRAYTPSELQRHRLRSQA